MNNDSEKIPSRQTAQKMNMGRELYFSFALEETQNIATRPVNTYPFSNRRVHNLAMWKERQLEV